MYKACQDYEISGERYKASENVATNARLAFEAAEIPFQSGLINHFEYISKKDGYLKAQNEAAALKYDVQFKMNLLRYYQQGGDCLEKNIFNE